VGPDLQGFLAKEVSAKDILAVADGKLGASITQKMGIQCLHDSSVMELMRGLRSQIETLVSGSADVDLKTMALGLSHSLSRYKLKFSPDKIDTMIVQAIGT
jgi:nucleolar protein 58